MNLCLSLAGEPANRTTEPGPAENRAAASHEHASAQGQILRPRSTLSPMDTRRPRPNSPVSRSPAANNRTGFSRPQPPPPHPNQALAAKGPAGVPSTANLTPRPNQPAGVAGSGLASHQFEGPRPQPALPPALRPSSTLPLDPVHRRGPAMGVIGGPVMYSVKNTAVLNGTGMRRMPR
jgi:hypothetical protein